MGVILLILFSGFGVGSLQAQEETNPTLDLSVRTGFGRYFDPDTPQDSFTFEPKLAIRLTDSFSSQFQLTLERPNSPHEGFLVPKAHLGLDQEFPWTDTYSIHLRVLATALELDQWSDEGYRMRYSVSLPSLWKPDPKIALLFEAGVMLYGNQFSLDPSGEALAQYGFFQRVRVSWKASLVSLFFELLFEERKHYLWKTDYGSLMGVLFEVTPHFSWGLNHELLSSVVDENTGSYRSFSVTDSKLNRFSVFLEWSL